MRNTNDYVPTDRNVNARPSFPDFGPVTVDPRSEPEKTPYQSIKVTPQQNVNDIVGQPTVVVPPSQGSPAVKQGR